MYAEKAVVHGVAQGILSEVQGGDFRSGFLGGAISSFGIDQANGRIIFAVIAGGTAAELSGGKFSNGAFSASMVAIYNYMSHINERVDADGDLSLLETRQHWKEGNGEPLNINIEKLRLFRIVWEGDFAGIGTTRVYNLLGHSEYGFIFGSITLTLLPNHQVMAKPDTYNFNMQAGQRIRNSLTRFDKALHGTGKPFIININGTAEINSGSNYVPYSFR